MGKIGNHCRDFILGKRFSFFFLVYQVREIKVVAFENRSTIYDVGESHAEAKSYLIFTAISILQ